MNAAGRLGLYAAGAGVAFAAAFAISAAVVPDAVAASWNHGENMNGHDGHSAVADTASAPAAPAGVSLAGQGYVLAPVTAPASAGEEGELAFRILGPDGEAVTGFATAHEKQLHLIVVRTDGAQFRHVHPHLDAATGTWSLPWTWDEAGAYRVYADFTPAGADAAGVTLSRLVHVGGAYSPVELPVSRTAHVDGFTVELSGDVPAGATGDLTVTVTRDGQPVTTLEPYLGAFGHLVALREGDLAYLHVHAEGDEPEAGETSGPEVEFMIEAPTAGRYLLYLDFRVDGVVHTAAFVLEAGVAASTPVDTPAQTPTPSPSGHSH